MSDAASPERRAMQKPGVRRFYREATVVEASGGFSLMLDGRAARTPARALLAVPSRAFGNALAQEWQQQGEFIDPAIMPLTKLANSAIDGVTAQREAIIDDLTRYAGSDLLCYRADVPSGLVEAQAAAWDPILEALQKEYGIRFTVISSIVHTEQPPCSIAAIRAVLERAISPFTLAALHVMTTITGSVLCSLACAAELITAEQAWSAAHVDELYQEQHWGRDEEALARRKVRRVDFMAATKVVYWLGFQRQQAV